MFSGIIQEVGLIKSIEDKDSILQITVLSNTIINQLEIGSSVAVDGCCQTVVQKEKNSFKVQATCETLLKTNFKNLKTRSKVNLESSLKLNDLISGHLVSGHIDSPGEIVDIENYGENNIVKIKFPKELNEFIAPKGAVCVNGVSLTVIDSKDMIFSFTLIPFTRENTNLGLIKKGYLVNLEVDLISRYLVNYMLKSKELVKH